MECKGRLSAPTEKAKEKAKEQAKRVVTVNGVPPVLTVGGIMHFRNDVLEFFWRDPPQDPERIKDPIGVNFEPNRQPWAAYYQPVLDLVRSDPTVSDVMATRPTLTRIDGLDLSVSIEPSVFRLLRAGQWDEARSMAQRRTTEHGEITYERDGIRIVAGETWLRPFEDEGRGPA